MNPRKVAEILRQLERCHRELAEAFEEGLDEGAPLAAAPRPVRRRRVIRRAPPISEIDVARARRLAGDKGLLRDEKK